MGSAIFRAGISCSAPSRTPSSRARRNLLRPGQTALAVADGEGRNGVFIAEHGLDVLAMDLSPTAIAKSQALAKERGVTVRIEQADLETWSWPVEAFDVVVGDFLPILRAGSCGRRCSPDIKRALKPGGLLLMRGLQQPKQTRVQDRRPVARSRTLYTRALLEEAFAGVLLA